MSNKTIREMAYEILRKVGKPLHYREITKRAKRDAGWAPDGPTPEYTMNSRLSTDINDNGSRSTFVRVDRGVYGLREWGPGAETIRSSGRRHVDQRTHRGSMSFKDAAEQVLRESGKAMHYGKELWPAIKPLVKTDGLTPANTLYSQVLQEISKRDVEGKSQRFARYRGGYIGLAGGSPRKLGQPPVVHEPGGPRPGRLRDLSPTGLEALVGKLLSAIGYDKVTVTPATRDRGIDVTGLRPLEAGESLRVNVQVKHWKAKVQAPDVQRIRGASRGRDECVVITSGEFSSGAVREANRLDMKGVKLIDGTCLESLLGQFGVQVNE